MGKANNECKGKHMMLAMLMTGGLAFGLAALVTDMYMMWKEK